MRYLKCFVEATKNTQKTVIETKVQDKNTWVLLVKKKNPTKWAIDGMFGFNNFFFFYSAFLIQ